jgi:hypothetical protein
MDFGPNAERNVLPRWQILYRTVQEKGRNVTLLPDLNREEISQVNACRLM